MGYNVHIAVVSARSRERGLMEYIPKYTDGVVKRRLVIGPCGLDETRVEETPEVPLVEQQHIRCLVVVWNRRQEKGDAGQTPQ